MHKPTFQLLLLLCLLGQNLLAQNNNWQQLPGPFGGKINCTTQLDNLWYVGTGNGVYQSANQGDSWQRLSWSDPSRNVAGLLVEPNKIMLVTTTRDTTLLSAFDWTISFHLSTDQGQTWTEQKIAISPFFYQSTVRIYRHRGALILVERFGAYKSQDEGATWQKFASFLIGNQTIWANDSLLLDVGQDCCGAKYSRDAGISWTDIAFPDPESVGNYSLGQGNTILYFGFQLSAYRTLDFGNTWEDSGFQTNYTTFMQTQVLPNGDLAATPSDVSDNKLLFLSQDNGLSWKAFSSSPTSEVVSAIGGNGKIGMGSSLGFFRSDITGNYLTAHNNGILAENAYVVDSYQGRLFVGTPAGLWRSLDQGDNWSISLPQSKLFATMDLEKKGDTLFVQSSKRVLYSTNGGDNWKDPFIGGGSPVQSATGLSIEGSTMLVGGANINLSTNGGASWEVKQTQVHATGVLILDGEFFASGFFVGVIRSQDQGNTWETVLNGFSGPSKLYWSNGYLYVSCTVGLYRSGDKGETWQKSVGLPKGGPGNNSPFPVTAFAATGAEVYVGVDYHGIYKSSDYGATFSLFSNDIPTKMYNDMMIEGNQLYVSAVNNGIWTRNLGSVDAQQPYQEPLLVWPNPMSTSSGILTIRGVGSGFASVYDQLGKCVFATKVDTNGTQAQLDLGILKAGVYTLVFRDDKGFRTARVINP